MATCPPPQASKRQSVVSGPTQVMRRYCQIETSIPGRNAQRGMRYRIVEKFMVQPWVSTGSDGSGGHPRKYGTFTRKIREYGYMRGIVTLPQIVESSSSRAAKQMHIADRGELAAGKFADVIEG